jgi:Flp pilus assembly pilin Flp
MYKKGLIGVIIVIIIALIILGYFGFNIKDILNSSTVQANLNTAWSFVMKIWNNYLAAPCLYIWDKFFVGILWKLFQNGLIALGVKI